MPNFAEKAADSKLLRDKLTETWPRIEMIRLGESVRVYLYSQLLIWDGRGDIEPAHYAMASTEEMAWAMVAAESVGIKLSEVKG